MTKVTITFNLEPKDYATYNYYIDGILNTLDECNAQEIEIKEND